MQTIPLHKKKQSKELAHEVEEWMQNNTPTHLEYLTPSAAILDDSAPANDPPEISTTSLRDPEMENAIVTLVENNSGVSPTWLGQQLGNEKRVRQAITCLLRSRQLYCLGHIRRKCYSPKQWGKVLENPQ